MASVSITSRPSPIEAILRDAEALGLTPDQLHSLESIELDFQSEFVRLAREQELLLIETQRGAAGGSLLSNLSAENVRAIASKNFDLKLAWLRALERAQPLLSSDQQVKLRGRIDLFPDFDANISQPSTTNLDTRIADAVDKRVKDAKVVEIETTQAIAERLLSWAKSLALLVSVPLVVGGIILGAFGVKTYADFVARVGAAESDVNDRIKKAEQDAAGIEERATKLGTVYANLESEFGKVSAIAQNVRNLSKQVQTIEEKIGAIPLRAVFFDLGDTLGEVRITNDAVQFKLFPSSALLLTTLRETLGLKVGIISNVPSTMSAEEFQRILATAGLSTILDSNAIITSNEAGVSKPDPKIFQYAAQRIGVLTRECLYIGGNYGEVSGAQAAGMSIMIKPVSRERR